MDRGCVWAVRFLTIFACVKALKAEIDTFDSVCLAHLNIMSIIEYCIASLLHDQAERRVCF